MAHVIIGSSLTTCQGHMSSNLAEVAKRVKQHGSFLAHIISVKYHGTRRPTNKPQVRLEKSVRPIPEKTMAAQP